jgi:hypothetical protein
MTKKHEKKIGRPSAYTQQTADEICFRLSEGESLRTILKDDHMPSMSMVFRWLADEQYKSFREQYAHAKEVCLEHMAEEMLEIADETAFDTVETQHGFKADSEWIQRSKLRVDTRKWLLAKLMPKKYGDKTTTELTGADGGAIQIDDTERAAKLQSILAVAESRKNGSSV